MKTLTIALVLLMGCASLATFTNNVRERNRSSLMRLSLGMTKAEALEVMGTETDEMTSVNQIDGANIFHPQTETINNPYRSSAFTKD